MSWTIFFFNETATTEFYTYGHTLSLHDALPILYRVVARQAFPAELGVRGHALAARQADAAHIWPDEICARRGACDGDEGCAFRALRTQLRPDPRSRGICRRTEIGRASCRESVWQSVMLQEVAFLLKKTYT